MLTSSLILVILCGSNSMVECCIADANAAGSSPVYHTILNKEVNMAIRIRIIDNKTVALCAAISEPKEGDIYLDDNIHHALSTKFLIDFDSEGIISKDPLLLIDEKLLELMKRDQGGKAF
jgi:hypothetical protein